MRPLFAQERVAASAGSFSWTGFLALSRTQDRLDASGRRRAIRGPHGASRRSWAEDDGTPDALRDIVRDYALETLADPDAVLVLDETGFLKPGQSVVRRGAPVHRLGRQDHELPDRRVRRPCASRHGHAFIDPGVISAQGLGRTIRRGWRRLMCAGKRTGFATKPSPCSCDDRSGDRGKRTLRLLVAADTVYGVGEIESATARRQRLCSLACRA